jgi:hypothetical protein
MMIESVFLDTANLSNASSSLQTNINSGYSLTGVAFITVLVAVAVVFLYSDVKRIEWFHDKLKTFSRSLYYTAIGLASTVVIGAIFAPLYYLSQSDGQTQTYALYAVGGVIVAYGVFTGLGYIVDKVILSSWREYKQEVADNA